MAAGSGTAEAQHGAEAREKQNLVKLSPKLRALRSGKNLVAGHLAVRVDSDINQQAVRQRKFEVVLLRRPGLRIIRKRNQLGGTHQIESHIVLHGADGGARQNHLEHQDENENGGEESAGPREGQGPENVVEEDFGSILPPANGGAAIPRRFG